MRKYIENWSYFITSIGLIHIILMLIFNNKIALLLIILLLRIFNCTSSRSLSFLYDCVLKTHQNVDEQLYSRQLLVYGSSAQKKLQNAHILLIGKRYLNKILFLFVQVSIFIIISLLWIIYNFLKKTIKIKFNHCRNCQKFGFGWCRVDFYSWNRFQIRWYESKYNAPFRGFFGLSELY